MRVIDTHTEGEPTRVLIDGCDGLPPEDIASTCRRLRETRDDLRRSVILEPRGSEVLVGALVLPPSRADAAAGIVFFNNVGYLGMCGHGTMGVVAALGHAGRLGAGEHRFETPVGMVSVEYDGSHDVLVENVPSYRHRADVETSVPELGTVRGDVAWGGNCFYLVQDPPLPVETTSIEHLRTTALAIRESLRRDGITGADKAEIDHVEWLGPPRRSDADSRNFVLCPGGAFDRSPCGTGTSAKLACLAEDGRLAEGEEWRQESIVGSLFRGSYRRDEQGRVIPRIRGTAFVTAVTDLIFDPDDPFRTGITHG